MPAERDRTESSEPHYPVYGITPDRPLAFTVPPVEATPEQPLPNTGPFLRVFSGVEEPGTVLLRCAREFIGVWRHVYEHGRDSATVDEQLSLYIWLTNREASGHIRDVVPLPDAPMNPSSYGEMVAWLAYTYLPVALRQHDSAYADYDAARFMTHATAFDQLVADVQAGRVRLPEQATEVFPPKTVSTNGGGDRAGK